MFTLGYDADGSIVGDGVWSYKLLMIPQVPGAHLRSLGFAPKARRPVGLASLRSENMENRLVSAVLVEIDDKWATADKAYIKWKCQND